MKRIILILSLFTAILQQGCVEKSGYYTDGENSIIALICDITWVSQTTVNDEGITYGIYKFNKDGTYARTLMMTDKDGKEHQSNINGQWSFGDPSFSTIYFGHNLYWDIDKLTKEKFAVYERSGEFGQPGMVRVYLEFTPYRPSENSETANF